MFVLDGVVGGDDKKPDCVARDDDHHNVKADSWKEDFPLAKSSLKKLVNYEEKKNWKPHLWWQIWKPRHGGANWWPNLLSLVRKISLELKNTNIVPLEMFLDGLASLVYIELSELVCNSIEEAHLQSLRA